VSYGGIANDRGQRLKKGKRLEKRVQVVGGKVKILGGDAQAGKKEFLGGVSNLLWEERKKIRD